MNCKWINCPLEKIAYILNGFAFKSKKYTDSGIRIIRIANVQDGFVEDDKPVFYPLDTQTEIENYILNEGDLLMSLTGNVGRVALMSKDMLPAALNQRVACLRVKDSTVVSTRYLFHYFRQHSFQKNCVDNSKGTAQLNMSTEWLKKYEIQLPSLEEQHRIVERIENLFSQLDEARDKAQEALEESESRIASILHQAFTGALTAKQRKEKELSTSSWKDVSLKEIVQEFKYGTSEKSDYNYSGMPVLRIPNIGEDGIVFSDMKYLSDNNVDEENQIHENDILIIRSNGSRDLVGKCALVPKLDKEYSYASFLIRIKPTDKVRSDYLVVFLNSVDARTQMFAKAKSSAGIHNINIKELGVITLKLPELWEQAEIVSQVSHLLSEEKRVKEIAEQVIEQIASTKKAILAKAFRGELGTNDPDEENAVELLKTILEITKEDK